MLINHISEADYQKLLKAKENAGKVKEKVGYSKNPIKLPGNFLEGIDNTVRYSYSHAIRQDSPYIPHPDSRNNVKKTFIAVILLVAAVLLFYSIKQKKTA